MTKKEFSLITVYLFQCYNVEFTPTKANVWYDLLQDLEYNLVSSAVKKIAETERNSFNVNPAAIRKACSDLMIPDGYEVENATANVMGKLVAFGNNGCIQALEILKSENELAWKVAKDIGWYNLCYFDTETTMRNFEKRYREELKGYVQEKTLSQKTKARIGQQPNAAMIEG